MLGIFDEGQTFGSYSGGSKLNFSNMNKIMQYVNTGDVCSAGHDTKLNSGAIGSCVVITAFDSAKNKGAMAYIMLSGIIPPINPMQDTRYAAHAIEELFSQMNSFKVIKEDLELCIIGGANVLKRENDCIGNDNLESVERLLLEENIEIKARSIAGFERRTVLFDIEKGYVYFTVGDSKQEILWQSRFE